MLSTEFLVSTILFSADFSRSYVVFNMCQYIPPTTSMTTSTEKRKKTIGLQIIDNLFFSRKKRFNADTLKMILILVPSLQNYYAVL